MGTAPVVSGKGKAKTYGDQLVFSGPLDLASAQNPGNYRVTVSAGKKKTKTLRVVQASYNAATNTVTLNLGKTKPGKGVQVTVSGVLGADGTPLGSFTAGL
jgi:hypothetical protein